MTKKKKAEYTTQEYEKLVEIHNAYVQAANEVNVAAYLEEGKYRGMCITYDDTSDEISFTACDDQVAFLMAIREEILDYTYLIGEED